MSKILNGINVKNIPWEDRPQNYHLPIWRYSKNPIIKRDQFEGIERIFNSSLVPFNGEFKGVFRCDCRDGSCNLHTGYSKDGYSIEVNNEKIHFLTLDGKLCKEEAWSYDPRVIKIDDEYYVVWCDEMGNSPTLGIAKTKDFVNFYKYDGPFMPNNRNGVLFPRKINGKFFMLSRPSDTSHTPFGDIFISESKDMEYWGKHKVLLKSGFALWNGLKIGGGPAPIETDEGWLVFIHGVNRTCNGYVYMAGAMILDRDDPTKILNLCKDFVLSPSEPYETTGFVDHVVFPTSIIADQSTGKLAIYYGCADTCTSLAFTTVDIMIDYIKKHDCLKRE